ncbi:galactosylgalactosylxylosylprotein 3-beta-glucuronosyltransferase I [Chelonus insularis]|uniref:galactosylgalactosylxylosylprotein 3-beta-glucuronosyltransferase I n=1 Tax=Chelonus insularis TaxID=460826 RepID=UPI001588AEC4|nr:galactosylgalactosylxylosylprotein 3-beta-glucuronosyltransferase I [Chelonus insularis]
MTSSTHILIPPSSNNNMINIFRPYTKHIFLFFIIYIVIFSFTIIYINQRNWEDNEKSIISLSKKVAEQNILIEHIHQTAEKLIKRNDSWNKSSPTIYAITPTFARPVQKAELTRLAQTFLHIPNFHWIVVEDATEPTSLVTNFLWESGLSYQHLHVATAPQMKLTAKDPHWKKPRGAAQRNAGLAWLRNNLNSSTNGIVYFADDDNTYSIKLFQEMEKIKVIGVWPVGLVGGLMVERPICDNKTNKIIGFNSAWKPDRPFPFDMAAFALNLKVVLEKKDVWFTYTVRNGYQETDFLQQMVTLDQLEPLADCCTKVYVWHTRTEAPQLKDEQRLNKLGKKSNDNIEV